MRTPYTEEEIDAVAVYCGGNGRCYLLPSALAAGRGGINLRLTAARNGQRGCINLASQYELSGAVAQLEERRHGMAEVRGSSPLSSTPDPAVPADEIEVGAHEFRNRFGYYLDCAAAGRRVSIKRHGKPHAELGPPTRRAGRGRSSAARR